MGTFNDAIDHMLVCPKCGEVNAKPPAKPSVVREQDGSYTCAVCSATFRPTVVK